MAIIPQMCNLLEYFCDQELQHRVESLAAFAERYVDKLQANQRDRYAILMKAFTMTAAETARRTREFRSPPQEQVLWPLTLAGLTVYPSTSASPLALITDDTQPQNLTLTSDPIDTLICYSLMCVWVAQLCLTLQPHGL